MRQQRGLFSSLFDLSFRELITKRIVRFLYGLAIIVVGLIELIAVITSFGESPGVGIITLIVSVLLFLLWVMAIRVLLETVLVIFDIAEYARDRMTERQGEKPIIEEGGK